MNQQFKPVKMEAKAINSAAKQVNKPQQQPLQLHQLFGSPTRYLQYDVKGAGNMVAPYSNQSAANLSGFFDDSTCMTPTSSSTARAKRTRSEFVIPKEVIDDICARFPLTIAGETASDEEALHLLFVVEECFWFYLDYSCRDNATLRTVDFETFARQVFERYNKLTRFVRNFGVLHREWLKYKKKIPVHGAVLIDSSLQSLVLIWQIGSRGWFFPKGKINEGESPRECAIREVLEECGYDCSALIDDSEYVFIPGGAASYGAEDELPDGNVDRSRLFLVAGVARDATLAAQSRYEIAKIEWFRIDDLRRNAQSGESGIEFLRVNRLLPQIEQFVQRKRAQRSVEALRSASRPAAPVASQSKAPAVESVKAQKVFNESEQAAMDRYVALHSQNGLAATLPSPDSFYKALLRNKSVAMGNQSFAAPSWNASRLDTQSILLAFKQTVQ